MKWILSVLTVLALAGPALSQDGNLVVVRDSVGNDITRFGLREGAQYADANATVINTFLRNNTNRKYTLVFPGGKYHIGKDTTTYSIHSGNDTVTGTCIELPMEKGQVLMGKGYAASSDNYSSENYSGAQTRFVYAGPRVDLSDTETYTYSITDDMVTWAGGYSPIPQDVGATVEIDGAYYVIVSVVDGTSWTLDRSTSLPAETSETTGLMTYSMIKSNGVGAVIQGIGFMADGTADHSLGSLVCLHIGTNSISFNQSKLRIEDCGFSDFKVAILNGRDMRHAFGKQASYTGTHDDHCDHTIYSHLWIYPADGSVGIYCRNIQALHHEIQDLRFIRGFPATTRSTAVYFERGGFLNWDTGGISGGIVTALRLGVNGSNQGDFTLTNVHFDGSSSNQKFLETDSEVINPNRVTMINCSISDTGQANMEVKDDGPPVIYTPLWKITGGSKLVLINCFPVPHGSIEMLNAGSAITWTPQVSLHSCTLGAAGSGIASASDSHEILSSTCETGTRAFFWANASNTGAVSYDNGKWIVGTGWTTVDHEQVRETVVSPVGANLAIGNGQAYFAVPAQLDGWRLSGVYGTLSVASSSGQPEVQLRRNRGGSDEDMLSDPLKFDETETDTTVPGNPYAIDSSNDGVATGDRIYVDVDAAGTGAQGLHVVLTFSSP
jgi:hypothetical protein